MMIVLCAWTARAWGTQIAVPEPPEPTEEQVLAATRVDATRADAVYAKALELLLRDPSVIDRWIPALHEAEQRAMADEYVRRAWPEAPDGQRAAKPRAGVELQDLVKELVAARPKHPARQVDALLRRLGRIDDAAHRAAGLAAFASTPTGRWKAYAAAQEILARVDVARASASGPHIGPAVYPLLLRDLPPRRAGELAGEYLRLVMTDRNPEPHVLLWLAWSLSHTDPKAAAKIFEQSLTSPDPAERLMAGRGLARLTGDVPPFRLTAPPAETAGPRAAWVDKLAQRAPAAFAPIDPLAAPLIKRQRGGRVDLIRLKPDATPAETTEDVWPTITQVLPDGTAYGRVRHDVYGLLAPDGTPLARFDAAGAVPSDVAEHGGLLLAHPNATGGGSELGADGAVLWSNPRKVSILTEAGLGRFATTVGGKPALIDRRGDVLWTIELDVTRDGVRQAHLVAEDTMLVVRQHSVEVWHRTEGLKQRVAGFVSNADARYHPTQPWLVIDGAHPTALIVDPRTGVRATYDLGWDNESPTLRSKWAGRS